MNLEVFVKLIINNYEKKKNKLFNIILIVDLIKCR